MNIFNKLIGKRVKPSEYLTIHKIPHDDELYWQCGPPSYTKEEWMEYAKKKGYTGLRIFEDNEKVTIEVV
jgi:hypothetical protein